MLKHVLSCNFGTKSFILLVLLFASVAGYALVDDPGIHKSRLIQQNDSTYVLEVDVSQKWLWAIRSPILPSRFKVSEQTYVDNGKWFVSRVTIISSGAPLNSEDTILLPWDRNGADLTAFWLDGSVYKGLFLRDFTGIEVPLNQLLPQKSILKELISEQIQLGLKQFHFYFIFLLFALSLVLFFKSSPFQKGILHVVTGFSLSIILAEWGVPGFSLIFANILAAALVVFMGFWSTKRESPPYLMPALLLIFGLIFGLSYYGELKILELSSEDKSIAQFIFLATLTASISASMLVFNIFKKFKWHKSISDIFVYLTSSLAIAVLIIIYSNPVTKGDLDILQLETSNYAKSLNLPPNESAPSPNANTAGKVELTTPIMSYLTIEPYEVHHELLVNARTAVELIGEDTQGMSGIPVGSLSPVKEGIKKVITSNNLIIIDSVISKPSLINVDFVTLSAAGVLLRDTPVPESLDEGIIGITLVYETLTYPKSVSLIWKSLSKQIGAIETTTVDPFGTSTDMLTNKNLSFNWENTMISVPKDNISSIALEQRRLPYLSYLILTILVLSLLFQSKKQTSPIFKKVTLLMFGIAVVCFPFLRFHLELPYVSELTPSKERSEMIIEKLLTNVYKSFDVRNEEMVYDRLELSVTGDKLTQIYLENRKSLEFENRGGARANIDKVIIEHIGDVKRTGRKTFTARTEWLVNGSVGHFGHTHYRRNYYDALITFKIVEGTWKINDIELVEEIRLL